ncbi:hypothetical protein FRC14_004631 [Serendipita sp. 396]|nr:hypothetical protein FRC14_004631 [Serendipita sp. 396]KAG8781815.1 hypothetical protein FRC15_008069 [Serendipita sp. 397]KAG8798555.1 hypothetical protein FRC16_007029 [Serendipita sp. 398]KAG8867390.1 hypothetical protein FRC20_005883 [Serendipita sp. 405]
MSESGDSDVTDDFELFRSGDLRDSSFSSHRIRDYPVEVLGRIFIFWRDAWWARHLFSGVKQGHLHYGMRAPFVLAAVCRKFRLAAERTPDLWAFIYVDFASQHRINTKYLSDRLERIVTLAGTSRLTLCFQDINTDALRSEWFKHMQRILDPTRRQWSEVLASFSRPEDLAACWKLWPLATPTLSTIRLLGSVEERPTTVPGSLFLAQCQALRKIELRNLAWIHSAVFPTVETLSIGPSTGSILGQTSIIHLCKSFPSIVKLRLLAFEDSGLTAHAEPFPGSFELAHLKSLTVSPVLLRTSLVGLQHRRHLPALMSVSIHFSNYEDVASVDGDDDDEGSETKRRSEDLQAVGDFLRVLPIETLKLCGLDKDYEPLAIRNEIFEAMNKMKLKHLYFKNCTEHTTQYIGAALRPVAVDGAEGSFYLAHLRSVHLIKCRQVDGVEMVSFVRVGPRSLKKVVVQESDIDEESYEYVKALLSKRG